MKDKLKEKKVVIAILGAFILIVVSLLIVFVITASREEPVVDVPIVEIEEEPEEILVEEEEIEEEEFVPGNENLLTGLSGLSDEAVGMRPVAVVISNVWESLPQYGVGDADIIIELPVEGGLTRLLALYGDYTQVPVIIPTRSFRIYMPIFALAFDSICAYWGMDNTVADQIAAMNLDAFDASFDGNGLFGRDQARLNAGYGVEHASYFLGPRLPEVIHNMGIRTELIEEMRNYAFRFYNIGEFVRPEGRNADVVSIAFGAGTSRFTFDSDNNVYLKEHNGNPHVEASNNEQLAFTNVFILETNVTLRANGVHVDIDWAEGSGYYLSGGVVQEITWEREGGSYRGRLLFFDSNGEELRVNRGKSYIGVNHPGGVSF
jgi:hypothetical protein